MNSPWVALQCSKRLWTLDFTVFATVTRPRLACFPPRPCRRIGYIYQVMLSDAVLFFPGLCNFFISCSPRVPLLDLLLLWWTLLFLFFSYFYLYLPSAPWSISHTFSFLYFLSSSSSLFAYAFLPSLFSLIFAFFCIHLSLSIFLSFFVVLLSFLLYPLLRFLRIYSYLSFCPSRSYSISFLSFFLVSAFLRCQSVFIPNKSFP